MKQQHCVVSVHSIRAVVIAVMDLFICKEHFICKVLLDAYVTSSSLKSLQQVINNREGVQINQLETAGLRHGTQYVWHDQRPSTAVDGNRVDGWFCWNEVAEDIPLSLLACPGSSIELNATHCSLQSGQSQSVFGTSRRL